MQGRGWTLGESEPLLMTVNEDDFQIDVHVKLQGEVSAGLCCFYNPEHCAGILADAQGVSIIRHNRVLARHEGTGEQLWLRMELKQLYLRFYVSQDGRQYQKINNVIDISGYNHNNYDGFLSVKPGFSVIGKGQAELSDLTIGQARRKTKENMMEESGRYQIYPRTFYDANGTWDRRFERHYVQAGLSESAGRRSVVDRSVFQVADG